MIVIGKGEDKPFIYRSFTKEEFKDMFNEVLLRTEREPRKFVIFTYSRKFVEDFENAVKLEIKKKYDIQPEN